MGGLGPAGRSAAADARAGGADQPGVPDGHLGRAWLSDDAVIVEESPSNRSDFRRHVPIRRPGGFYATPAAASGLRCRGGGMQLADRSRPVVCLVGDGSALYGAQAAWSAVQLRTPVAFVVVNIGRYAILESAAQFGGLRELPSFELPGIDFVSLAASLGCEAARVEEPARLRDALRLALVRRAVRARRRDRPHAAAAA